MYIGSIKAEKSLYMNHYDCVNKLKKLVRYHPFLFFVKMVVVKQKYLLGGVFFFNIRLFQFFSLYYILF